MKGRLFMNQFLDFIYNLIFHPKTALYIITSGERIQTGALIWLFTLAVASMSSVVEGAGLAAGLILIASGSGISILVHSAVIHYTAGLCGGRGSARGLTAGFLSSVFPYAFSVFAVILTWVPGGELLYGTLMLILFFWSWALDVWAVRQNYGFSTAKAFLISLVPAFFVIAVMAVLMAAGLAAALMGIAQMGTDGGFGGMMQQL